MSDTSSSSSSSPSPSASDAEDGEEHSPHRNGDAGSRTATPRKLRAPEPESSGSDGESSGDEAESSGSGDDGSSSSSSSSTTGEGAAATRGPGAPEPSGGSVGAFVCDTAADALKVAGYLYVAEAYITRKRGGQRRGALGRPALAVAAAVTAYRAVRRAVGAAVGMAGGSAAAPDAAAALAAAVTFVSIAPSRLADAAVAHAAVHCVRSLWPERAASSCDWSALVLVLLTPVLQMEWLWLPDSFPKSYRRVLDRYSCWEEVLQPARRIIRSRGPPLDLSALVPDGVKTRAGQMRWHAALLPRQMARAFSIYLPLQLVASAASVARRLADGRGAAEGKRPAAAAAELLASVGKSSLFISLAYVPTAGRPPRSARSARLTPPARSRRLCRYWVPISITTAACGLGLHRTSILSRPFPGHLKIAPWIVISGFLGTYSGLALAERRPNRRRLLACYIAAWVLEVAKNAACSRAASRRANALALPLLACVLFGMRPERQAPWVVRFLRGEDGRAGEGRRSE